ncbi:helix-turn-helix transcriptional regulator [Thiomicrospira microaerophila]|uniref:helix-turn-helix transcriptional regulator n=1 Tax=Thiomicrospira microaerophila TaxID=406020 RepID=UPI0005CB46A4|nr:AlpA family phage regulatory protein [Thiomicrospira microaerophila]
MIEEAKKQQSTIFLQAAGGAYSADTLSRLRVMRAKQVHELTKISIPHIYKLARDGGFPKPRKLTANTSVWLESEVLEWMNERLGLNG